MSTPTKTTMYDLVYVVGGKVIEVVEENKSISICKWKASQIKDTTHKLGLLQERKVSNRPVGGWANEKRAEVEVVEIQCFSLGMRGMGKCPHQTIAVVVNGNTITKVTEAWSTEPKWQSHDIGYERKTNMPVWCRDYNSNRAIFNKKYGEGNWIITWYNEIPAELKGVFNVAKNDVSN